ncbi:response regulator transcription factor [Peribacillus sp. SCS-155]|uniref:response regulator n=1 Tax=Peribacillus sedimenti TaxID=3115297 RepID=UPI0039067553
MVHAGILIVEDQELMRKGLKIVLESNPAFQIVGMARNGLEGIMLCEKLKPDLILMDIHMPIMNGIDATKSIKQLYPDRKILILSTFKNEMTMTEAMAAGADGYVLKATDPALLLKGVDCVLQEGSVLSVCLARIIIEKFPRRVLGDREYEIAWNASKGVSIEETSKIMNLHPYQVKFYQSCLFSRFKQEYVR